jgi:NADH-quinone oxidoreductase subunit D
MLRCTNIQRDLRLDIHETYANYSQLQFKSYISKKGDSYDRYLLRMNEMVESLLIINQLLEKLTTSHTTKINKNKLLNYHNFNDYSFVTNFTNMEQTINHFKY